MASLGTLALDVTANTNPFVQKLRRAKAESGGFAKSIKTSAGGAVNVLNRGVKGLTGSLAGLLAKLGLFGGAAGIGGIAAFSIKAAADLESTKTAFATMLGSAEKADKVVGKLFDFSKKTPFEPDEVFGAGRRLLATGISTGELEAELRTLGDIAAGSNSQMADIVDIYAKIRTKGKASLEELNRLSERGININAVLAKTLGKTGEEISEMVTKGTIKLPEIQAAFKDLTTEGGMFNNAMEAQSKTLNGMFSTLKGNLKAGSAEIGTSLVKAANLKGVLKALNSQLEDFDWKSFGESAASAFKSILAGAKGAAQGVGGAIVALKKLQSGLLTLVQSTAMHREGPGRLELKPHARARQQAIDDTFNAKRREIDESIRTTEKTFAEIDRALEAAIETSKMPAANESNLTAEMESLQVEMAKNVRMFQTSPDEAPVVEVDNSGMEQLLNQILQAVKNPNIKVARPA
jgi:tape measure domain-containing protein